MEKYNKETVEVIGLDGKPTTIQVYEGALDTIKAFNHYQEKMFAAFGDIYVVRASKLKMFRENYKENYPENYKLLDPMLLDANDRERNS